MLHVDADDGRLLDATDEMTGEPVPYGTRKVNGRERKQRSDAKKMTFERETDRDAYPLLARFFGNFLCLAEEIRVHAVGSSGRLPTACSYRFPPKDRRTRLPARFDYATCRLVVPVHIVSERLSDAARVVRRVAADSRNQDGHGHPGLTRDDAELRALRARAWNDVDDDVVATPYREKYSDDWFPVLREDGDLGLYASDDGAKTYVVVENALPHFACDQLRVLFADNPSGRTWEEWTRGSSEILDRAIELSGRVAEAVASRAVEELARKGLSSIKSVAVEKTRVFVNRLFRQEATGDIRYDAGVLRGSFFHSDRNKKPKALFRVGERGYALVEKRGFEPRDSDVFPANLANEDEMRAMIDSVNNVYSVPIFLREVSCS